MIAAIEASARTALPAAEERQLGDWLVRISGGTTKRVNSANPVAPGARVEPVRADVERAYADHRLPSRFRLTPLADPSCDGVLAAAGYRVVDESWTMVAPLAAGPVDPAVRFADHGDAAWYAGMAAANGWSADDDLAHRALLDRLPAGSIVATLDDGDGPVGWGAAGLGDGRLCLFDIVVAPDARGRGVGRRLVGALLAAGAAAGRCEALLQVLAANAPARALYASLGFIDAYPYHYRIA